MGEVKRDFLVTHGVASTAPRQALVSWFPEGYFNLVFILHVQRIQGTVIGKNQCFSHFEMV